MDIELKKLTVAEAAADELGLDLDKIAKIRLEMDTLRRTGILLDITINGATLFERKAEFMELGIADDDKKVERYSPGSKYLLPKEVYGRLKSVVTQIRALAEDYGEDISGFYPYRWYSYKAYWAFRLKWDKLVAKFDEIRSEIMTNYDFYREGIIEDYAETARTAWDAITKQGYGAIILETRGQKRAFLNKNTFVDAIVDAALSAYPSYQKIESELKADYRVGVVYADTDFQHEYLKKEALKNEANAIEFEAEMKKMEALNEARHVMKMNQLAEEEKEVQIEAMLKAEMGRIRQSISDELTPLEQVVEAWRGRIAKDCQEIYDSLKKNGFLKGKVAQKAAGLVTFYDLVATHNDRELREKLVILRNEIGTIGDERTAETLPRDAQKIAATIEAIMDLAHKSARNMDAGIRASFLE